MYNHDSDLNDPKLLAQAKKLRWNPITVWVGLDSNNDWSNAFYINLPEYFKPSPLHLIFKDLTNMSRTIDPKRILFSLIDFDAY